MQSKTHVKSLLYTRITESGGWQRTGRALMVALMATLVAGCLFSASSDGTGEPAGDNILLVILDDVGIDQLSLMGYGGATPPRTPTIDAIGKAGLRFRNAWSMPECSPGRAAMFDQATYAWGDDDPLKERGLARIWNTRERAFPVIDPKAGGATGTAAAMSFPPNGYGLFDMTGNAWQWVADWYRADQFSRQAALHGRRGVDNPPGPGAPWDPSEPGVPADAPRRVIRGGSFLCNPDYCLSYRPSARRGADPASPMSHLGFRLVKATG